jgi:hypothetical protein
MAERLTPRELKQWVTLLRLLLLAGLLWTVLVILGTLLLMGVLP